MTHTAVVPASSSFISSSIFRELDLKSMIILSHLNVIIKLTTEHVIVQGEKSLSYSVGHIATIRRVITYFVVQMVACILGHFGPAVTIVDGKECRVFVVVQ